MVVLNNITKKDCETIIKHKLNTNDFEILNFQIVPFADEMMGFMGDHCRLKIQVLLENKPTEVQLFLKRFGPENPFFDMSAQARCYEREIFYLQLVSENRNNNEDIHWIPKIYFAKENLFVLEDLSLSGFLLGKNLQKTNIDYIHTKVLFKSLAKMHAFSIILEEKRSSENKPYSIYEHYKENFIDVLFSKRKESVKGNQWFEQSVQVMEAFVDIMPGNQCLSPEQFKKLCRQEANAIKDLFEPSKKYRNVLCHGDLWFNNFLFKYNPIDESQPEECCIIDFQLMRYLPPMHDIQFYFYINLTTEMRKKYADELIQYYYSQLTDELRKANLNIDEIIPWDSFIESSVAFERASKVIAFLYKTIHLLDDAFWSKFHNDKQFLHDIIFVNRTKYILEHCKRDKAYRCELNDIMIEIRDTFQKQIQLK